MWFRRPYDWGLGLAVQHEILPRFSVEASYNRRWWGNDTLVDNLLLAPSDFNEYSVTAPSDARLPGGGGYVISDLWAVKEAKFGQTDDLEVPSSDFGKQVRYFHAVDTTIRGQVRGLTLRISSSTGRQVTDNCELIYDSPSQRDCHVALPFQTNFTGLLSYTIPRIDLQASGVFRSSPGSQIQANRVFTSADVARTLGRPLPGGAQNVTINLLSPGEMYRDRINLTDLRFAKLFRFGTKRLTAGLDVFNAFNSSVVLNSNNTFGNSWLTPTAVQPARQMQVSAKFDF
jgi:hypothetical protein